MLVLKNGRINTMVNPEFIGDVAIEDSRILAVGRDLDFDGADVIDVTGKYVMPGFVDAHCHIGMWEDYVGEAGSDGNECTDPTTPELRAIDAINPFDRCFEEAASCGITTCVTGPGSGNVVGGQFVAMKTAGKSMEDMTLRFPVAMKAAFGENPKRVYGEKDKCPSTRMATAAVLRKELIKASEYAEKIEKATADKPTERDLGLEMMAKVVKREMPLKIHAHRADDILTAIRIAKEFNIRFTLDHCTEGYMIPDLLKDALANGCEGIIVGPLLSERSKIELKNLSFRAPRVLWENGIEFAMMTDSPVIPEMFLPVCAAIAVREGLPEYESLKSITVNAAKVVGLADRVGSIEVGKDADIAVFDRHPFDFRARCKLTLINGKKVYCE